MRNAKPLEGQFVVPENVVRQMRQDGYEIEEIANSLCVNKLAEKSGIINY